MRNFLELFKKKPNPAAGALSLVKSRPSHLVDDQYLVVDDLRLVQQTFERLKDGVFNHIKKQKRPGMPPPCLTEWGKLGDGRQYFYVRPWNQEGFLFEMSPHGWLISKAEKIARTGTFLRANEPWDVAVLHKQNRERATLRVSSKAASADMLSLLIYEEKLPRLLGL
jgi:hypothetical protein